MIDANTIGSHYNSFWQLYERNCGSWCRQCNWCWTVNACLLQRIIWEQFVCWSFPQLRLLHVLELSTIAQTVCSHGCLSQAYSLFGVAPFVTTPNGQLMVDRNVAPAIVSAAKRRILRRLRSHWRHEQFSILMALATAAHHSHMRVASMDTQDRWRSARRDIRRLCFRTVCLNTLLHLQPYSQHLHLISHYSGNHLWHRLSTLTRWCTCQSSTLCRCCVLCFLELRSLQPQRRIKAVKPTVCQHHELVSKTGT